MGGSSLDAFFGTITTSGTVYYTSSGTMTIGSSQDFWNEHQASIAKHFAAIEKKKQQLAALQRCPFVLEDNEVSLP